MSEDTGRSVRTGQAGESQTGEQPVTGRRRLKTHDTAAMRARVAAARARVVGLISTVVRWAGNLAAVILTAHVVLTVGGANPDNGITRFVAGWADPLALGFQNLFPQPDAPKLDVLVNYGLAAIFWMIVTSLVVKIIRALG